MNGRTTGLLATVTLALCALGGFTVPAAASAVPEGSSVRVQTAAAAEAAPSPSPTLGSTTSGPANAPGSGDADPQDYNGAIWAVVAAVIVAVIVGGGTLYLTKTRRLDISQRTTPEDEGMSNSNEPDRDHR